MPQHNFRQGAQIDLKQMRAVILLLGGLMDQLMP